MRANIGFHGSLSTGKSVTSLQIINELAGVSIEDFKNGNLNFTKRIISNQPLYGCMANKYFYLPDNKQIEFLLANWENPPAIREMFQDSVYFVDEIYNLIDARRSSSSLNEKETDFFCILGKINCSLVYTTQVADSQTDVRLFKITDIFANPLKIDARDGKPVLLADRIYKDKEGNLIPIRILVNLEYNFPKPIGVKKAKYIFDPSPFYGIYKTDDFLLLDRDRYLKKKNN